MGKYPRPNGTKAGTILPVKRNTCTAEILNVDRYYLLKWDVYLSNKYTSMNSA